MKKTSLLSVLSPFLLFGLAIFVNYFTATDTWALCVEWVYSIFGGKPSTDDIISASKLSAVIANLLSFFPIVIQTAKANYHLWKKRKIERDYLELLRDSISRFYEGKGLVREITKEEINIRVFRRKGARWWSWIKKNILRQKYGKVISKDIDGSYAQRIGSSIVFDLKKDKTCVTEAFLTGKTTHEFINPQAEKYKMSDHNRYLCSSTKFVVAYPIPHEEGKVKYVFSVDSTTQLCVKESYASRYIDPIRVFAHQYDQVMGK